MKRRDFITKTSFGAALAGGLIHNQESLAKVEELSQSHNSKNRLSISDSEPVKEVIRYTDIPRSGMMVGSMGAGGAELRKDGVFL